MDAKSLPFLQSERHALEPLGVPGWNMFSKCSISQSLMELKLSGYLRYSIAWL